jgi:hypothetical protein
MVSHRLRAYYDELIKCNNAPTVQQQHNIMLRLINKERDSVTATALVVVRTLLRFTHTHTHKLLLLYCCVLLE